MEVLRVEVLRVDVLPGPPLLDVLCLRLAQGYERRPLRPGGGEPSA